MYCKCVPLILHWFVMFVLRWPLAVHRTFKSNYKSTFIIFRMSKKVPPRPLTSRKWVQDDVVIHICTKPCTIHLPDMQIITRQWIICSTDLFSSCAGTVHKDIYPNTWHCQGKWYQNKLAQIQSYPVNQMWKWVPFFTQQTKSYNTICSSKFVKGGGGLVCIQQLLTNKLKKKKEKRSKIH